ncbi:hypothetical protein ACOMHN_009989 [Nucella lapillus]
MQTRHREGVAIGANFLSAMCAQKACFTSFLGELKLCYCVVHQTGKAPAHLDKPQQLDEMMSSSSRETNGTDSGRGLSEDDSQAPLESARSDTESGFSSFLAMPLKDGWRHVGNQDYVNSPQTSLKTVVDTGSPTNRTGCHHPPGQMHDRHCPCSRSDLDLEKPRLYENTASQQDSAPRSFRTHNPKKSTKSVHFNPHGSPDSIHRKTLPPPSSSTSSTGSTFSLGSKSREPRFQPQFQSSRPRYNSAQPAHALSDYVNTGTGGRGSGGRSPKEGIPQHQRQCGELVFYGTARRGDGAGDSLNDSADTADEGKSTTSGSYTLDHEDRMQDLQSDMFV